MSEYKKITANRGLISLGNTGARLSDPRATYVKILNALVEFRKQNKNWETKDQADFGKLLGELEFFDIKTDNKVSSDKDVRVKTGFIDDFGFTTEKKIVTNAGKELLENSNSFDTNEFDISKESFTYLKQFLKYQQNDFEVFPLLSLIYAIIEFDNELPIDFVTYVWSGSQTKKELIDNIKNYKKYSDYKETVYQSVTNSENTKIVAKNATHFFATHSIADKKELKELLYAILPHGKGNTFKDKTITLFHDIHSYWLNKEIWNETKKRKFIQDRLKSRHKDISSKKPSYYLESLFDTTALNNSSDWKQIIDFISEKNKNGISEVSIEEMYEKLPQIIEKQNLNMKMNTIFNIIRGELNKHEENSNHKDNMQLFKRTGRGLYCLTEKAKNYVGR